MHKRSKMVKGPKGEKIVFPKPARYFSRAEKELIIQEYLTTSSSKNKISLKYLETRDHDRLLVWMRKWGHRANSSTKRSPNLAQKASMITQAKKGEEEQKLNKNLLVINGRKRYPSLKSIRNGENTHTCLFYYNRYSRRGFQYLHQKKVRYQIIERAINQGFRVGLATLCEWFGISRQTYYKHKKEEKAQLIQADMLIQQVRVYRMEHPSLGVRKVYNKLQPFMQEHSIQIGRDKLFDLIISTQFID